MDHLVLDNLAWRPALAHPSLNKPTNAVAALFLVQILVWTIMPAVAYLAPPLDVVENYVWGPHWLIGSYKHPAMPSWMLEISRLATGATGWPSYLASQLCVASVFVLTYVLGRDVIGAKRAAIATLLLPWIYYFGWHTTSLNHDIVQMPFWAAIALLLWRAVDTGRITYWIALGICAGVSLYTKLSVLVLLATCGLWIVLDARARDQLRKSGPWIALAIFAVCAFPLLQWIQSQSADPAAYAVARGGGMHAMKRLPFTAVQLGVAAGVFVPIALLRLSDRIWPSPTMPVADQKLRGDERRFVTYLATLTVGPIAMALIGMNFLGTGAKLMWGVPMLNLVGLLAVTMLPSITRSATLPRLCVLTLTFIVGLAITQAFAMHRWPENHGRLIRSNWPQAEISKRLRQLYSAETGRPPTIVAGQLDNWISGLVAISGGEILDVYTSGSQRLSPWVTPERLARDGALIVWNSRRCRPPPSLSALTAGLKIRSQSFQRPRSTPGFLIVVCYAILPPKPMSSASTR